MVDTFGTGKIHDDKLVDIIRENFDLKTGRNYQNVRFEKTDLQADSSLWSLWTY